MKITVVSSPLDRFLCARQEGKNTLAVDYVSRDMNLKADIHFCVLEGKLIYAEGKIQPIASTFSKHSSETTSAAANH